MTQEAIARATRELFSICAAVAALETLARERRAARPFRTVCALAASVCALRAMLSLFQ